MSHHLASIMGAIRRVKDGLPPEDYDKSLIVPLLESYLDEYTGGEIQFRQVSREFVVDTTEFRNLLGFQYLQSLLKQPNQWVATRTLSPIGEPVVFEPVAEHGFVRKHLNRKFALTEKLKKLGYVSSQDSEHQAYEMEEQFKIAEELLKIEKYLSNTTFGGKIKHIHNNYDRNRQTVVKCIRLAINYLKDHPDTAHIGQHIEDNIKTGALCRYTGKFKWKF